MQATLRESTALVIQAGDCICAFHLADVIETMRPLPVSPLPDTPAFLRGISIIRGVPTPVIDLGVLIDSSSASESERFVCVRSNDRTVSLLVSRVFGVRTVDVNDWSGLPGLIDRLMPECVQTLGTLDNQLLLMLRAAKLLPPELWKQLEEHSQNTAPDSPHGEDVGITNR